jgi:hypothetical protein
MKILSLPQELLGHILGFLSPTDITRFGRASKASNHFVNQSNQILWKSAFLHLFDDPNDAWSAVPGKLESAKVSEWDWYRELKRRLQALKAAGTYYRDQNNHDRAEEYVEAILSIIDTAKFTPTPYDITHGRLPLEDDRYLSRNLQLLPNDMENDGLESLVHDTWTQSVPTYAGSDGNPWNSPSRPVTRSMTWSDPGKHRPESASRLHVLYGLTRRERVENRARGFARRKVYDWSLSGPDNDYGPFKRDGSGRVDWSLLEGIHSVIARNFALVVEGQIAVPQGFCFSIPHRTLADPTVPEDWARVTGQWLGTYSFLDYADLLAFNTWDSQFGPSPTLDDEPEACGDVMRLELKLDKTISSDPRLHTSLPISADLPQLFFSGLSKAHTGMHRPSIGVRGSAMLMAGNREVRWRFIIAYGGQDQWQLEGVQPGGVRSGGVFGLWSQCDHEPNGPVGPFCYYPVELCKPTSVILLA